MTQRPISLHHLTMLDADPGELVSLAAAAGYEHAGLRIISPDTGEPFGQLIGSEPARRDLRARAADLPGGILDVEAYHAPRGRDRVVEHAAVPVEDRTPQPAGV